MPECVSLARLGFSLPGLPASPVSTFVSPQGPAGGEGAAVARPSHIECVLFDCDGVIVDSEPLAARRNMRIFHELGAPVTYEDCLGLAGVSGHREIPALFAKYGVEHSFEEFNSVRTDPAETPETYLDPDLRVYDGLRELLASLRAAGVQLGLVSTTVSARILTLLDRFRLVSAFDVIVTGDMVARHKPDPEPYQKAMSLFGVEPEGVVVFEDSTVGIAAGKASEAYVVGVQASAVKQDVSAADELLDSYVGFDLLGSRS